MPESSPHIAEDHFHDGNGGTEIVRNLIVPAVIDGASRVPRIEDGGDRQTQLHARVLRKFFSGRFANFGLKLLRQTFPAIDADIRIAFDTFGTFFGVDRVGKTFAIDAEHDVAEHC